MHITMLESPVSAFWRLLTLLKNLLGILYLLLLLLLLLIIAVVARPVSLLTLFGLLGILLVHFGLLAGLLVGSRCGCLGRCATLGRSFGIGRGEGERVPGGGEKVGDTHCDGGATIESRAGRVVM